MWKLKLFNRLDPFRYNFIDRHKQSRLYNLLKQQYQVCETFYMVHCWTWFTFSMDFKRLMMMIKPYPVIRVPQPRSSVYSLLARRRQRQHRAWQLHISSSTAESHAPAAAPGVVYDGDGWTLFYGHLGIIVKFRYLLTVSGTTLRLCCDVYGDK